MIEVSIYYTDKNVGDNLLLQRSPTFEKYLCECVGAFSLMKLDKIDGGVLVYSFSWYGKILRLSTSTMAYLCGDHELSSCVDLPSSMLKYLRVAARLTVDKLPQVLDLCGTLCFMGRLFAWRMENGL